MLSISDHHPPPEPLKKPKSPELSKSSSITAFRNHHPRSCLIITILLLQIFLLFLSHSLHRHPRFSTPTTTTTTTTTASTSTVAATIAANTQCDSGKVYVYDLPPFFNKELLQSCDNLNPWSSRCDALTNDGFGPPANGLDGIVPESLTPAWYWTDQFVSEAYLPQPHTQPQVQDSRAGIRYGVLHPILRWTCSG
ncbi:hypothetical protein L1049_019847 [Liquidambar formosana]|uniref:Uncharacterized protein n=1 Tax=Liquidambar formosana TaxID=63359 RepID=A0AAP0X5J9_LIQFO